jgi:hypothetical protein
VRSEALYIWRELLAARGLIAEPPRRSDRPRIPVPGGDRESARRLAESGRRAAAETDGAARQTSGVLVPDLLAGIVAPALLFAGVLAYRLRRDRALEP